MKRHLRVLVDHGGGHPAPGVRVERQAHVGRREVDFAIDLLLHGHVVGAAERVEAARLAVVVDGGG